MQWSTLENGMVLGTGMTSITLCSKPLWMSSGLHWKVGYQWRFLWHASSIKLTTADSRWIDHDSLKRVGWLLWHLSLSTNHWWCRIADHCGLKMNSQWSTAENWMVLGVPTRNRLVLRNVTPITICSKLLVMQYWWTVIYFGNWNVKGDYCDMCQDTVDHCGLSMNSQWCTAEGEVVLGITVASVTMHSKWLVMQNE